MFRFIQAGCGRGRAATIELEVLLLKSKSLIALVQPYVGVDRMNVLPDGVRSVCVHKGEFGLNLPLRRILSVR